MLRGLFRVACVVVLRDRRGEKGQDGGGRVLLPFYPSPNTVPIYLSSFETHSRRRAGVQRFALARARALRVHAAGLWKGERER